MKKSSERVCFIVNPSAGKRRMGRHLDWLQREADELWEEPAFKVTRKEADLELFARESADDFDKIIACGGDGTVNRVIAGVAESNTALGLIPVGSGNDFAKAMGLPSSMKECLRVARKGRLRKVDLIRVSGDVETWCANTLGCGLDGWANHYKSDFPWARGTLLYGLGALKAIAKFGGSEMEIVIEDPDPSFGFSAEPGGKAESGGMTQPGKTDSSGKLSGSGESEDFGKGVESGGSKISSEQQDSTLGTSRQRIVGDHFMVTICNGPVEGGSFRVAPDADFSDGWLDLLLINRISFVRLLWYLPQFFYGPRESMEGVSLYRSRGVRLRSREPLAVHCDGEHMGVDVHEIKTRVHKGALTVVVPA